MLRLAKVFFIVFCVLISAQTAQAYVYNATALTGGAVGALDAIDGDDPKGDASVPALATGDFAIALNASYVYFYYMNAASGAAESSPDVIAPDTNAGTKRWLLIKTYPTSAFGATLVDDADAATVLATLGITGAVTNSLIPGYLQRAKFRWKDADEIYIGAAVYHHKGTTEQLVYWDSELTFQFGAGGSNAASDALGNNEWHYIYLDDSAIVTQGAALLDADCFLNDTTAPTWNAAEKGWYNGSDRCIGAVRTSAAGAVLDFTHDGGDAFCFDDVIGHLTNGTAAVFTDVTIIAPGFCTRAAICIWTTYGSGGEVHLTMRRNGSTAVTGNYMCSVSSSWANRMWADIFLDASQIVEYKLSANTSAVSFYGLYYYFPTGM